MNKILWKVEMLNNIVFKIISGCTFVVFFYCVTSEAFFTLFNYNEKIDFYQNDTWLFFYHIINVLLKR